MSEQHTDPAGSPRVWTLPAHDELRDGGESVVLVEGQVHRVSRVGTLIRDRAVPGATVVELAAVLEETFGAPPAGEVLPLTHEAVQALLQAGLLATHPPGG